MGTAGVGLTALPFAGCDLTYLSFASCNLTRSPFPGSDLIGLSFLARKSARLILLRLLRRALLDSSGFWVDFPMVARDATFLARVCVDEEC
jgi:hypothetical protein